MSNDLWPLPIGAVVGALLEARGGRPLFPCVCGHAREDHGGGRCRTCPQPTKENPRGGCSHYHPKT